MNAENEKTARFATVHEGDHQLQAHIEERKLHGDEKPATPHLVVQDLRGGAARWHHPERDEAEIRRLRSAHPEIEELFHEVPEHSDPWEEDWGGGQ